MITGHAIASSHIAGIPTSGAVIAVNMNTCIATNTDMVSIRRFVKALSRIVTSGLSITKANHVTLTTILEPIARQRMAIEQLIAIAIQCARHIIKDINQSALLETRAAPSIQRGIYATLVSIFTNNTTIKWSKAFLHLMTAGVLILPKRSSLLITKPLNNPVESSPKTSRAVKLTRHTDSQIALNITKALSFNTLCQVSIHKLLIAYKTILVALSAITLTLSPNPVLNIGKTLKKRIKTALILEKPRAIFMNAVSGSLSTIQKLTRLNINTANINVITHLTRRARLTVSAAQSMTYTLIKAVSKPFATHIENILDVKKACGLIQSIAIDLFNTTFKRDITMTKETAPPLNNAIIRDTTKTSIARTKTRTRLQNLTILTIRTAAILLTTCQRRLAILRTLLSQATITSRLEKVKNILMALIARPHTQPKTNLNVLKTAQSKVKTRTSMRKLNGLVLTAAQVSSAKLTKVLSLLKSITAQVLTIPVIEKTKHYIKTLHATSIAQGTRALDVIKRLSAKARIQTKLNRALPMRLIASVASNSDLVTLFIKRVTADMARRILAPLKRQPYRPGKRDPE